MSATPVKTIIIDAISSFCGHRLDIMHDKGRTITEAIDRNIEATEIGS